MRASWRVYAIIASTSNRKINTFAHTVPRSSVLRPVLVYVHALPSIEAYHHRTLERGKANKPHSRERNKYIAINAAEWKTIMKKIDARHVLASARVTLTHAPFHLHSSLNRGPRETVFKCNFVAHRGPRAFSIRQPSKRSACLHKATTTMTTTMMNPIVADLPFVRRSKSFVILFCFRRPHASACSSVILCQH